MKYLEFLKAFKGRNIITYQDVKNVFGSVNHAQLSSWRSKKQIIKLKRGMFILPESAIDLNLSANELNPSYISLEYALSYYQIIPDIARIITSVSKARNEKIQNELGNFYYYKISPTLYTGFTLKSSNRDGVLFKIATPEKALFDLVYFRKDLRNSADFDSLRLTLNKRFKASAVAEYSKLIKAEFIKKRINELIKYLNNYDFI